MAARLRPTALLVGVMVVSVSAGTFSARVAGGMSSTQISRADRLAAGRRPVSRPYGGLERLPSRARSVVSAALGSAQPEFLARRSGSGFTLQGGGVAARLDRRGAALLESGSGAVSMTLTGVGRGRQLHGPEGVARVAAHANRVVIDRGSVLEWYAGGPLGVEQGFTITRRPVGGSGRPVTLELGLAGALAARQQGPSVSFLTRAGRLVLKYGELSATDARGRPLHSSLRLRRGRLLLQVSDAGARYPLRIDPLIEQGSKLAPAVPTPVTQSSYSGDSVAVSSDGNTAVVGGYGDNGALGAAWVFVRSNSVWVQDGPKLTPSSGGTAYFGWSVAVSGDGGTILVGAPASGSLTGSAWVFTPTSSGWTQQGPALAANDETGNGWFGTSVALAADGNTALVGGQYDNGGAGAAWAFTRSGSTWTQQGSKLAGGGEAGSSVALSSDGNTALVGTAQGNDALVYTRSAGSWAPQATLTPNDATNTNGIADFGASVALSSDGNTALIGGPGDHRPPATGKGVGAAWVFTRSGSSWSQQGTKLIANDESSNVGGGEFGASVSLTGDGNTALIGGPGDGNYMNGTEPGAAWVFTRSGTSWAQDGGKLTPSDENQSFDGGSFGASLAVSSDGTAAMIGGPNDSENVGAAWAFGSSGSAWSQAGAKLIGLESGSYGAGAGYSVAVSGDGNTALVGGPDDADVVGQTGAVWVFVQSGGTWTPQASIAGCDGQFGASVALSLDGNTALIGCPGDGGGAGSAWVFTRSAGTWTLQGSGLSGSDEDNSGGGGGFGASVALSALGDTALIGAPFDQSNNAGAAWVFTRSGSSWSQQGLKLTGTGEDNSGGGGAFGSSVALSSNGNAALIGGPTDGHSAGAAWVFTRSGSSWAEQGPKLTATGEDNSGGGAEFGFSVALSAGGNTALIGGPFDGTGNTGAAWAFILSGSTWSQQAPKLTPSDEAGSGWFGFSVALSADGNTSLIGGPADGGFAGATWLFGRSASNWSQEDVELTPADGDNSSGGAEFGFAVALSSSATTLVVGGPGDGSYNSGAAWPFAVQVPDAPTDVSATAGNGQATVSFSAPVGPVGYYSVSASPGGQVGTGFGSPITVSGLANGTNYTFRVDAVNSAGTGLFSVPSNAVAPSSFSGGGGGGGGGGGAAPDLAVTASGPVSVPVGGQASFSLAVSDLNGVTANNIHLLLTLPAGGTVAASSSDRGSGCTTGTGTVDCSLDFLSGTLVAHVTLVLTLPTAGTATLTATVKAAQADKNPADNTASATVQVGATTTTTTPTSPPPVRKPAGADHINGSAKADHLTGSGKADIIKAGAGNDWVNGGAGNDTIYGGPGNDILYGGLGSDTIYAGPGNDTIHVADGAKDSVDCGPGRDTVYADKHDKLAKNCEHIHRS